MNLLLLILIPLFTAVAVLLTRNNQQVKWISLIGAAIQLVAAITSIHRLQS